MRHLLVLLLALAFVAVPTAALAQEPYSSSTTTTGNLPPTTGGSDDPGVPYTGFGLTPFAVAITALVLLGSGTLWYARRARDKADD